MIRNLIKLGVLGLIAITSCEKANKEIVKSIDIQLDYHFDTVIIERNDHFLFLNMGLTMSDFSEYDNKLYNLNPYNGEVEVIDILKGELTEVIQYDFDGPNSIRTLFTSGIKKGSNGNVFFLDQYIVHVLDSSNNKISSVRIDKSFLSGDRLPDKVDMDPMGKISATGSKYVTFYREFPEIGGRLLGIAIVDLVSLSLKIIPIESLNDLNEFDIRLKIGDEIKRTSSASNYISWHESNVIISNSVRNEVLYYDYSKDSLSHLFFTSSFTSDSNSKRNLIANNDEESFDNMVSDKFDKVNFGPIIQDSKNGLFYRFSQEHSGYVNGEKNYKHVLAIFDKNFSLIHEEMLNINGTNSFRLFFGKSFFIDNILYCYLNINDEMAFVRLHFNFNNL
ncbi:protein of unknown function [Algoriphagus alkaliphilus]|uniref:TolB-like 6-blade propeller-like n=1 Tax=Algoriphagus alkaliphilus TaxID=279824 RepID=A0A1G5ZCA3_9BACT|nr:DUF4221 family protein [Algoriphagus alkaliphilus]SDA92100.1 protein of unknown function [Algoriphagus alkaliphilus]